MEPGSAIYHTPCVYFMDGPTSWNFVYADKDIPQASAILGFHNGTFEVTVVLEYGASALGDLWPFITHH